MKNRGLFMVTQIVESKENEAVDIERAIDLAGHGRYNYFLLLACCITHLGSVVDMLGYSIIVPAAKCDLKLTLAQSGMLTSVSFAGYMFALPWGYYADTRGRRKALLISTSVGFIFSALSSFSVNFIMMLILKFVACSFSSASFTLTNTFLGECIPQKHRNRLLQVQNCFNLAADILCFGLAYLYLPLTFKLPVWSSFIYKPWRLYTLTLTLPLGVGALMISFLYESPKFLANKGKEDKALEVLKSTYQSNGGCKDNYPVKTLIDVSKVEETKSFWESIVKQTAPIFKPPMLWRSIQLFYLLTIVCATNNVFFMWFPTMVNSFYNSNGNETKGFCQKILSNLVSTTYDTETCDDSTPLNTIYAGILFATFFVAVNVVVTKLSSWRKILLTVTFLMAACGAGLVNQFENEIATMALFIMIQLTGICIGTVASYYVEIFPTSYRGLASSLGTMVARFCCLAGVNLVGGLVADYCQPTFYGWTIFILTGIIAALLLPSETKINK